MKNSKSREEKKEPIKESLLSSRDPSLTSTEQISESVALLSNVYDDAENATATSQSDSLPNFGSSEQLKRRESWYGVWSCKSFASTKVANKSTLADNKCHKNHLNGSNMPEQTIPELSARPPSSNLENSKDTLETTTTFQDDVEHKHRSSHSSKPNSKDRGSPEHLYESVLTNTSTSDQRLSSPVAATKTPIVSYWWFSNWLGISSPHMPQDSNLKSVYDFSPQNCAQSICSTTSKVSASLDSSKVLMDSQTPGKIVIKSDQSSSWYEWISAYLYDAKEKRKAVEDTLPEQIKTSEDLSQKDSQLSQKTELEKISSWSSWLKESGCQIKDLHKTSLAGSNKFNYGFSSSLASGTSTLKRSSRARLENGEDNTSSQAIVTSEKMPPKCNNSQDANIRSVNTSGNTQFNLLLPPLRSTYGMYEAPSTLEKVTRIFQFKPQKSMHRIFLTSETPKLKKALVIGVHGLFPAPFLRTVIGQPTGTSSRFANYAAKAVRRWAINHGAEECEIEELALEGGGRIIERVENLWKILLNWVNHAREADFLMVACHSQGVPVAIILISRLIEFGIVSTCRIGVCAMAGVSLGPFLEYKSRLIGGSPGELFDLADPESDISKIYARSLGISVDFGVRILFCGSIDDQLISLESSVFSSVSHPYIYRAVFIDGRLHSPDFLTHLVGFALKLRNLGISDHGLIRELSTPLAGNLYTGEGHSRLYDDIKVYDLAVEYALETTSVKDVPLMVKKRKVPTLNNPYVLPWIMRGLLEEEYVRTKLVDETTELIQKFDAWKPATKILKDVKYRLEALKSKL